MKNLFILLILSSCTIVQIGNVTDLHKESSLEYKDIKFIALDIQYLKTKKEFSFFYLVNFDCEKNIIPKLQIENDDFYLIENSIMNIEGFYEILKAKTNSKTFYYIPDKGFKNPNKDFEAFLEKLRIGYIKEQKGYLVKAVRKE